LQKKRKWKTPKKNSKKAAKVLILAQKTHIRDAKTTFLVCFFRTEKSVFGHPKMPSFFCQNQPSKALFQRAFCFSKRCFPLPSKNAIQEETAHPFHKKRNRPDICLSKSFLRETWEKMTKTFFHYILR
jgi:hypothetical protein